MNGVGGKTNTMKDETLWKLLTAFSHFLMIIGVILATFSLSQGKTGEALHALAISGLGFLEQFFVTSVYGKPVWMRKITDKVWNMPTEDEEVN